MIFVCPLTVDPPSGSSITRHRDILDDIKHFFGESQTPFKELKLPPRQAVTYEGEQQILRLANELRGKATLTQLLAEASGAGAESLDQRMREALALVEQTPVAERMDLSGLLLPLVPTLRSWLFDLSAPALATAILVGEQLTRLALRASHIGPSIRRIATIYHLNRSLLRLLARADRPVSLKSSPKEVSGENQQVTLDVVQILRAIGENPARATLREWLDKFALCRGYGRVLLLRALARAELEFG